MRQLTQKLKSGNMTVREILIPAIDNNKILIKNYYSLISSGTEGSTVSTARKSIIGKIKERPQQFKQVLEVLKTQGIASTYRAVNKKLDSYSPLGYSCAGEVISVGDNVKKFSIGDKVACAGVGYANHAEVVAVPVNLTVKLPENAIMKYAAYNTLGAIAMQGVRQADVRVGETCVVIGLGLIGQLTCLILKASGVKVIGVDVSTYAVDMAKKSVDMALLRNTQGIEGIIDEFAGGIGADAVIITAATDSLDPVNFAGAVARKKGKVIIVGAVPTGFDREPHYYRKELELKMACSYGPGRYDINYEEKGIDYPAGYVRWTEKRNMEAFQQLIHSGAIDLEYLTTHEFSLEEAPKAYDIIVNKTEPHLGMLIRYDTDKVHTPSKLEVHPAKPTGKINIAFIGAGSYAQSNLLPYIPKNDGIRRKGVLTNTGTTSKRVAEKFGFEFCTSNESDIFKNSEVNSVFIATRHDSHGEYVLKSLEAGKHVFVEKPLCLTEEELESILSVYGKSDGLQLMVGFNRRFSPLTTLLKNNIVEGPMTMIYRINAGEIPPDSWIQDRELGGGRIIGEVCHFIDYLTFMNGSHPVSVFAQALPDPAGLNDTVNIQVGFSNGSTGIIAYYANGSKKVPKEYVEVYRAGTTGILQDFKKVQIFGKTTQKRKLFAQNKGQKEMMTNFFESLLAGGQPLIPFKDIYYVTKATFAVHESLRTGSKVTIL
jgi:predicted dehydrogenase/threonine dehydrogenase-like Zn-dependent dehydrogenase